jgi:putative transposase
MELSSSPSGDHNWKIPVQTGLICREHVKEIDDEEEPVHGRIIGILKEQEAGAKTQDLCRRHGISGTTFFKRKARFGGLEASDARRLRSLEDENRGLKKLLAEQMLDNAALKDLVGKNF